MRLLALVGLLGLLSGCGAGVEEAAADAERSQQASEAWCRSYTTQQYCPKYICAWYSYPAPGYCGLPAESVTGTPEQAAPVKGAPEQAVDCPGPAECTTNSECDAKCGGPGTGVCTAWTCVCAA